MVKNLRATRPRAKWKIDAPTIIVLSTSKNAAAVRSVGGWRGEHGPLRRDSRGRGRLAGPDGRVEGRHGVEHARRLRDARDLGTTPLCFSHQCLPPLRSASTAT